LCIREQLLGWQPRQAASTHVSWGKKGGGGAREESPNAIRPDYYAVNTRTTREAID
jgi:hypothetical protein